MLKSNINHRQQWKSWGQFLLGMRMKRLILGGELQNYLKNKILRLTSLGRRKWFE